MQNKGRNWFRESKYKWSDNVPRVHVYICKGNYIFVYIEKVKGMYEDTGRQKKKKKFKVFLSFYTLHKTCHMPNCK